MWSSGPAPHGHSSGKGWREQVRTRQPAEEKRIAVACPMPRLPPVSSIVRRGPLWAEVAMESFYRSGVKPRLRPGLTRRGAAKFDTVVQAERTVMPKLELERGDAPAAPAGRAWH